MNIVQSILTVDGDKFAGTLVTNVVSFIGSGSSIDQSVSHYFYTQPTNKIRKDKTATDLNNNSYVISGVTTLPTGETRVALFREGAVT